jgi:ABC-type transport system involved in multi-copper enzyme maturation permease subunit
MSSQLLVNTRVHLRFYARNRLLLAFGLVMLLMFGVTLVPMLLFESSSDRFNMLRSITSQMSGYALVFTASLGLFAVSSHLRNRNVKLILTKPCTPENWLASIFLSALVVALTIYGLLIVAVASLSWFWSIPWQWGFVFVALDGACRALIQMSFLTCLATGLHPVVAVLVALFFNEGIFYQLKYLLAGAIAAEGGKPSLLTASVLCDALYLVMPMADPLSKRTESVYGSLRVSGGDWLNLGVTLGYTVLLSAFLFLISDLLLRRKRLI